MIRKPIAAGYFYSENSGQLADFIDAHKYTGELSDAMVIISPHAGYIYSGAVSVKTLSKAKLTDTVIILGVNHTGFGEPVALWDKGLWETPFGNVEIDEEVAADIIKATSAVSDVVAHVREHSIEVIVPILKYLKPNIKIVPIVISGMNMSKITAFANDLSYFMGNNGCSVIVSSDMNHYENKEITDTKDFLAIEQILKVDGEALYDTVMDKSVSMCGVYPATAALIAAKKAGASRGELVEHTTSGEVSGDFDSVVGYAGIIIK